MIDTEKANEVLSRYIRPQAFPVALKMFHSEDEIPDRARRPKHDLGSAIAACQTIAMARRYGWTVAVGKEDQCCPHAAFVLGQVAGGKYLDGSYAEAVGLSPRDIFAKMASALSRRGTGQVRRLRRRPSSECRVPARRGRSICGPGPDIPAGAGCHNRYRRRPDLHVFHRGIACSSLIACPMVTDQCQVVLSGAGDRYFALTQDHELAFAIPHSKVDTVLQGLEIGHKFTGHRYPTPFSMRLERQLPETYYRLYDLLQQQD